MELTADRVEWAAGVATASGNVVVVHGDERLTADEARVEGERLTLRKGSWQRADGLLSFDAAEIGLGDRRGRLVKVTARVGGATLAADAVAIGKSWVATAATLEPCACADGDPAMLSFRAREIEVEPGEVAIVRGGTIRVFRIPVLPVPYWREPLDPRRFRLLFPELGYGEYGVFASQHAAWGLGDWRFEAGPAWRQDRGARGELSAATPDLSARGELGWDGLDRGLRGAAASRGGFAGGGERAEGIGQLPSRLAWDASVVSDDAYVGDFGADYVQRGVPYRESRALVALDGLRGDVWLPDDGSTGSLATIRARQEFGEAVAVAPRVAISAVGSEPADARGAYEVGADARASGSLPWLHGEARATGAVTDGVPWAAAEGRIEVPLWTEAGRWKVQWWAGGVAETDVDTAAAGPSLRAETALGPSVVAASGAVLHDGREWIPRATAAMTVAPVSGRVQVDPSVQAGEVRLSTPVGGRVGAVHTDTGLWLGWAGLTTHLGRFAGGASTTYDFGAASLSGVSAYAGYDDGCSAALLTAAVSPDRSLPDLGVKVTLRK